MLLKVGRCLTLQASSGVLACLEPRHYGRRRCCRGPRHAVALHDPSRRSAPPSVCCGKLWWLDCRRMLKVNGVCEKHVVSAVDSPLAMKQSCRKQRARPMISSDSPFFRVHCFHGGAWDGCVWWRRRRDAACESQLLSPLPPAVGGAGCMCQCHIAPPVPSIVDCPTFRLLVSSRDCTLPTDS